MKKTIENLTKAFIGESQARNRYTFYASVAKKEGFEQIASLFLLTADNEKQHAKWFFRMRNSLLEKSGESDKELIVEAAAPATLADTKQNLKAAIEGENFEHTKLYPEFAETAEEEGHTDIAQRIRAIMVAEKHHEERYRKLLEEVKNKTVFKKEKKVYWVCRECGYVMDNEEPPEKCPSCDHSKSFFERKCEEY